MWRHLKWRKNCLSKGNRMIKLNSLSLDSIPCNGRITLKLSDFSLYFLVVILFLSHFLHVFPLAFTRVGPKMQPHLGISEDAFLAFPGQVSTRVPSFKYHQISPLLQGRICSISYSPLTHQLALS